MCVARSVTPTDAVMRLLLMHTFVGNVGRLKYGSPLSRREDTWIPCFRRDQLASQDTLSLGDISRKDMNLCLSPL